MGITRPIKKMKKYILILCILFLSCCAKQQSSVIQTNPTIDISPIEQNETKPLVIGGKQFTNYISDKAFTVGDNLDGIVSLEFFIDPLVSWRMNSLEGIEQLYNAKNIDRIRIDVKNLDTLDLSLLEGFANITKLDISINASSRVLPDLTAFKSLSVLSIREVIFEQPYTLYAPPGLTNLSIGRTNMHLVDLSVIETLHDLRGLWISGNITRLPDLTGLENLRFITIYSSQLESLDGIGAPNAKEIEIDSEKDIDSLSPLNNLPYLESLRIVLPREKEKAYKITDMANLPALETLQFYIGKIDLKGIENLSRLELLSFEECCHPFNIEGIGRLNSLERLFIKLTSPEPSLKFLRGMPNLSLLYLYADSRAYETGAFQVLDLSPLATLKKLQLHEFGCCYFIIKNVSSLDVLAESERGYIDFNRCRLYDKNEKSKHKLIFEFYKD